MRFLAARSELRRRLVPGLVAIALLAVAIVAAYTYVSYRRAATDLVIERDEQLAHLSASKLHDELSKFSDELAVVARTPGMTLGSADEKQQALRRARNRLVVFDGGVVLMDHFGRVLATEPDRPEILNLDWSNRVFFNRMLAASSPYFSDIVTDGPDNAEVVVMSVPVVGSSGELVGVLAGMFRLGEPTTSSFYASIVRLRLGQSGNTYLMDGSGRVLYDAAYNTVGAALESRLPYHISNGQVDALRTRDELGNDIVAAFAPVPGTDWTLITEDDWSTLTASVQRYARNLLLLLAFGLLLPPLGVAALIRQQHTEMLERQRTQHNEHVAELIHEMVVPRVPPTLPGWDLAFYSQQARTGKRNFHDVMFRPDGTLMMALGEVDNSGVRAAHLISSLRAILRGAAQRLLPPSEALECSAELLAPDLDDDTSLAYLYAVLAPSDGQLTYATAGFEAPCLSDEPPSAGNGADTTGLGTGAEAHHIVEEASVAQGQCAVLFSAGLVNARNAAGESFGRGRIRAALTLPSDDAQDVLVAVLSDLYTFTGRSREDQADDITIIVLKRLNQAELPPEPSLFMGGAMAGSQVAATR